MLDAKIQEFFDYAQERHRVHSRKERGVPRSEWTDDPILQTWRFTNIHREDDKVTQWFRENVRDRLSESDTVLPATVLFRWFNRIDIGEIIFQQQNLITMGTAWDDFLKTGDHRSLTDPIRVAKPKGPYVNGAYIIKGYDGMDKLHGVVHAFCNFYDQIEGEITPANLNMGQDEKCYAINRMKDFTEWLATYDQMGMFMAYEVACDLRWTKYLRDADDIMTWANPGPGARRGLSRIAYDHPDHRFSTRDCIEYMKFLLTLSTGKNYWPFTHTPWEMREVEHTLCEFDKYERIRQGGRGKRRYK